MDDAGIYARSLPDLGRAVQVGVAGGRIISVSFPRNPDAGAGHGHELLDRIEAYFDGEPDAFDDVTVALTLPTDRRRVLEALRGIPYGETVDVAGLARVTPRLDADDSDAGETVRAALAENPAPLLVPDHRVHDGTSAAPTAVADRMRRIEGIGGAGS